MVDFDKYLTIHSLINWVCVDLEINPESEDLISAGVLYRLENQDPVSITFKEHEWKKLFDLLEKLIGQDAVLIGHNLRRHDLPWLIKNDPDLPAPKFCIDTLELFPIVYPSVRSFALDKKYKENVWQDPQTDPLIGQKRINHPALDCRGTMMLLESIVKKFEEIADPVLLDGYRILLGFGGCFGAGNRRLLGSGTKENPYDVFHTALGGHLCATQFAKLKERPLNEGKARCLAYLLSLIPSDPDKSPRPPRPWVRYNHPEVTELIRNLRGTNCGGCDYCLERFDLLKQMNKLFHFPGEATWRNEGQQVITEKIMSGKSVLGVLPTSGGKSLTFQLPALINANNTGALTVVISPLRSLMDDQVNQLQDTHGRDDVCQISGKLNSIERQKNLRAVRAEKSDSEKSVAAHIVYMAPEQLRSPSVLRALGARGIGLLVIDEAHCMAKWGKDFRVEYRFIPELIARLCADYKLHIPPILCLTATARTDVLKEIQERFLVGLGVELVIRDLGHSRSNLEYSCLTFPEGSDSEKVAKLIELVTPIYGQDLATLIFCSTRSQTENLATKLMEAGFSEVAFYHGGCSNEHRKAVQDGFIQGESRLIIATNAFGMGVDKKDVRLVVHYDVPGSLENYVQEAGRAGRDGEPSQCVLFYDPGDLDIQLDLRRRNQLTLNELKRVILTIRHRFKQAEKNGEEFPEILISALDLMTSKIDMLGLVGEGEDEQDGRSIHVDEDDNSLSMKVATALGILEESHHLERRENIFQSLSVPFRITVWNQIEEIIGKSNFSDRIKGVINSLAEYLFEKSASGSSSGAVDLETLADQFGIERHEVKDRIENLRAIGICNQGNEYSINWDRQTVDDSSLRLSHHLTLLKFLLDNIEANPEITYSAESEEINVDNIRTKSDRNGKSGYRNNRQVIQDLAKLAEWNLFNIDHRQRGKLWVSWTGELARAKERFKNLSNVTHTVLQFLESNQDRKGNVTSKFNHEKFGKWFSSQSDLFGGESPEETACEEALLYMHSRDVVTVVDGFGILRARMKLVPQRERLFSNYQPAYTEYQTYAKSTVAQVKAMGRYADYLAKDPKRASGFLLDYFGLDWDTFTARHFSENERKNLVIPIRTEQYERIFGTLTPEQLKAVKAKTRQNHLILAGPGSGKTHVLVSRVFFLIKVRNVPAGSIAVLAYNRHADIELRRRLKLLLPKDWRDIGVHTFHGLALRLVGRDRLHELQTDAKEINDKKDIFKMILEELSEALSLNSGEDEREQLRWLDKLNGIEYLLVDEFQDISEDEYRIVKLLSRLESGNRANAVSVMAVGDDDQNLYAFRGSSVEWIRQFEEDFKVDDRITLLDNFRSVQPVIEVASRFICRNKNRLKPDSWIQKIPEKQIESKSLLSRQDPDGGRVVRLKVNGPAEARYAIGSEVSKMRGAFPDLKLGEICIAHHTNTGAHLTKKFLEKLGIPSQVLGEHQFATRYQMGVIEVILELERLDQDKSNYSYARLQALISSKFTELSIDQSWMQSWGSFFDEDLIDVAPDYEMPVEKMLWRIDEHLIGRTGNAIPQDKVASLTLHGTKGLEFHTVFLFPYQFGNDTEELRRLYFVGLSRAKVKAYIIDWPGCESVLWDEMEELAGDWLVKRDPQGGTGTPTKKEMSLAITFQHFDSFKRKLGTGMNIYFVADQEQIRSLKRDQEIEIVPGITHSGNPKLELRSNGKCVGMLKQDAVKTLTDEVNADWNRIIGVEVAQVIQMETEEDQRQYNSGSETHYYVVPRIFFSQA
jgi:ATP-dependent DNA helicase RecQ